MVELFSRAPDGLRPAEGSQLTPIPLDEAVATGLMNLLQRFAQAGFVNIGQCQAPPGTLVDAVALHGFDAGARVY